MSKRILVVNGHPDPRPERFCAALCDAYAAGAAAAGSDVERLAVGELSFAPGLPAGENVWLSPGVAAALRRIHDADRLAIIFPLWLDGPPGMLRELFESFARSVWTSDAQGAHGTASEKRARVFVTMDMPAFIQRSKFRNEATIPGANSSLSLPGVEPFEALFVGSLQTISAAQRSDWLDKVKLLGAHEE